MLNRVQFIVPGTPVPKARPRVVGKFAYTPARTAEYEQTVRWSYISQTETNSRYFGDNPPIRAFVECVYHYPKNWRKTQIEEAKRTTVYKTSKGDADNLGKAILDALNGLAYHDDSQVADMRVIKRYGERDYTRVILEVIHDG